MNGIIEQQNGAGSSSHLPQMAEPLHIQRLEAALDMRPFMSYARDVLSRPLSSPDDTEGEDSQGEETDDVEKLPGEVKRKKSKKLGTKQGEFEAVLQLKKKMVVRKGIYRRTFKEIFENFYV